MSIPFILVSVPICLKSFNRYLKSLLQISLASVSVTFESIKILMLLFRSIILFSFLWVSCFFEIPSERSADVRAADTNFTN